ncbi:Nucleoporin NUP188 [Yarrowia sp. B02]|nr:Nucleoporin NUP188 [Yarrowia sp. B02]
MASLWTYESVYYLLKSRAASSEEQQSLRSFFTANLKDLQQCCDPLCDETVLKAVRFEEDRKGNDVHKKAAETTKSKLEEVKKLTETTVNGSKVSVSEQARKDTELLLNHLNVSVSEAVRVVLSFPFGSTDDAKRIRLYTNRLLSERRFKVQVVGELFYMSSRLAKQEGNLSGLAGEFARKIHSAGFSGHVLESLVRNANLAAYARREKEPLVAGKKYESATDILGLLRFDSQRLQTEILRLAYNNYYFFESNPSSSDVKQWFISLDQLPFLEDYSEAFCYAILISLVLLDLDQMFDVPSDLDDRVDPPESEPVPDNVYFKDPETLSSVNAIIQEHLNEELWSPIVLAWSHVLQRVAFRQEETNDRALVPFIDAVSADCNGQSPYIVCTQLANTSLSRGVLAVTQSAYRGLPKAPEHSMVFMSLCRASFRLVPLTEAFAELVATLLGPYPGYCRYLLENTLKIRDAMFIALSRFPFDIEPFLYIMLAMDGEAAFTEVYQMRTFMQQLLPGFKNYTFSETDTNIVTLTGGVEIFPEFVIPPGTSGTLVPGDNIPPLVMWATEFIGWSYLGKLLSRLSGRSAALIIKLMRKVISKVDVEAAEELLRSASLWDEDIVEVIAKHLVDAYANQHIFVATESVKFFTVLCRIQPDRIWPFLSRAGVLAQNGRPGFAAMVLGSTEIVNGEYSLTLALLDLADTLIKNAVASSTSAKVSAKVQSDVLHKLTRHYIDVFESCSYWKYVNKDQRVELMSKSVRMFQQIVHYAFAMDNVVPVLRASAEYILDGFLTSKGEDLGPQRPLLTCFDSTSVEWVSASLEFLTKIVEARTNLELAPSVLEKQLFLASPSLVELYQQFPFHKKVIDLMTALVDSSWVDSEQPSLLAHLGQFHSQLLLKSLIASLENNLETTETVIGICAFFGAVVDGSSRQDGLSILLVTEKGSLLEVLETKALESSDYASRVFVHVIKAIALARNTWSTVTKTSKERLTKLVGKMLEVVDSVPLQLPQEIRSPKKASNKSQTVEAAYQRFSAAKAVQVLAQELFKDPETVGKLIQTKWSSKMLKLTKSFAAIQLYRSSLHGNLIRNFHAKFGLELFQFRKKDPEYYGASFVYDLEDMRAVFGASLGDFEAEIAEANLNLSLVNSETELSLAWGQLLVVAVDVKIASSLGDIVIALMEISLGGMVAPVFEGVFSARLEVIFHILKSPELKSVDVTEGLKLCWAILESTDVAFLSSLSGTSRLYKPVLRSISILVRKALEAPEADMAQVLHGISDIVLAKGSYALANAIQHDVSHKAHSGETVDVDFLIEDLRIMVVLLRNLLAFENTCVPVSLAQFALKIQDTGSIRSLLSLYSYSQEVDRVFGELTLLFLLELLQNDQLSEQVVLNGLVGALTEAPISREIQKGGLHQGRLYYIWIRGILPIMLTVLVKLGGRISPEITMLLSFFQLQIETAIRNLMEPVTVSLSFVDELQQIVVLLQVVPNDLKDSYKPVILDGIAYLQKHPKLLASLTTVGNTQEQQLHEEVTNGVSKLVSKILDRLAEVAQLGGEDIEEY